MKASNPKVMIQAYRLLVERLDAAHRPYPLHLGVTEAGDGEDGRIKGAIGIGALLLDGLGDTLRVSLTEDSVYEIPVARAIADKAMACGRGTGGRKRRTGRSGIRPPIRPRSSGLRPSGSPVGSLSFLAGARRQRCPCPARARSGPGFRRASWSACRRPASWPQAARELSAAAANDTPVEGLLVPVPDAAVLDSLRQTLEAASPAGFLVLDLAPSVAIGDLAGVLRADRSRLVLCRRFGPAAAGSSSPGPRSCVPAATSSRLTWRPGISPRWPARSRGLGDDRLLFTCSDFRPPASGSRDPGIGASATPLAPTARWPNSSAPPDRARRSGSGTPPAMP